MSPQRIIIQGGTATDALQDIKFQLSKLNQIVGTSVTTARATAVGTAGVSQLASKTDHKHPAAMATSAVNVSFITSTAGILDVFARGDHMHFGVQGYASGASDVSLSTSTGGVETDVSRGDHVHYLKLPVGVRTSQSRVAGTVYTNAGSGPLWLFISAAPAGTATVILNATPPLVLLGESQGLLNGYVQLCGVVKTGESYYLTADTVINVGVWIEYGF